MKFIRPLSVLLLLVAIGACSLIPRDLVFMPPSLPDALSKLAFIPAPPPAAQPKPPVPPPPPAAVQVMAEPRGVFDAARADLDRGVADVALVKLDALHPEQLGDDLQLQWHTLRASAYSLQGRLLDAVRERVAADPLLTDPALRRRNQEAILEALALLLPEQLGPAVASDPLSGWLALGPILANPQRLAQWRQDYPSHPADASLLQAYLSYRPATVPDAVGSDSVATAVAVLLPASGSNAAFGEAVRQGIVAAHSADTATPKPALHFYDSETGNVVALYQQAVTEGAGVVIGPLRKEQVAVLAEADNLPKPVLALNQVDTERDGFYQFGLLPEDELEQAASSAWLEGRQTALLLVPAKDFGQRMVHRFNDYWQNLGGRVAQVQTYVPGEKDFAIPIKKLLRVDEPVQNRPQTPRADADAIFLIAESRDARILVPQLRYYGATRLPIYATSMVYGGRPNRPRDQDLAGVVFCDAPWLLAEDNAAERQVAWEAAVNRPLALRQGSGQASLSPGADLHASSPKGAGLGRPDTNPRLWAMGMDAYRLSRQLDGLQSFDARFAGASGSLSLKRGNRIHRQLLCAQFDGGVPVPRSLAPGQAAH